MSTRPVFWKIEGYINRYAICCIFNHPALLNSTKYYTIYPDVSLAESMAVGFGWAHDGQEGWFWCDEKLGILALCPQLDETDLGLGFRGLDEGKRPWIVDAVGTVFGNTNLEVLFE